MPKRLTKKKGYYDPQAAVGYEILRNTPQIAAASEAQEAHVRDMYDRIDSENLSYRRRKREQDAELSTSLDRVLEDRSGLNRLNKLLRLNPALAPLTALKDIYDASKAVINTAKGLYDISTHADENLPEDYNILDWTKDAWNGFFKEYNNLQAQDAKGYQILAAQDKVLIQDYLTSLDKLDEIDYLNNRIEELKQLGNQNLTSKQANSLNLEIRKLIQQRALAKQEFDSLKSSRDRLESLTNQSELGRAYDDLMAGNGIYGAEGTGLLGKQTAAHNMLNDARRFLSNLNINENRNRTRANLKLAQSAYSDLNKEWNDIIAENEAEAKYHENKITPYFLKKEKEASIEFFNPDTYLYKMPGIMGGSASSITKQIPGMAASIAAAYLSGGMSAVGQAATVGLGAGFNYLMNYGAGISENAAEVSENALEVIKQKTGLTDKEITDVLSGKVINQKRLQEITKAVPNVENLFRLDMAATTWDAAVDAALQSVPIGMMSRAGKFIKGTKAYKKAIRNPKVREALRSRYGQDLVSTYEYTSLVSPVGGAVVAPALAAGKTGMRWMKNIVTPKYEGKLGRLGEAVKKKLSNLGKAADNVDPFEVQARRALNKQTNSKYLKGIGGRLIKSGISEGIEEGKQYLNAQDFKQENLPVEKMSFLDSAVTDAINGFRSGAYMLGIPLDGLGIMTLKDQELLQNIKGGMLGGLQHTGSMIVATNAAPYLQEKTANEILLQLAFSEKLQFHSQYDQYRSWLKNGLTSPNANQVLNSFEMLRLENQKHKDTTGDWGIAPELIDKQEERYKKLVALANNPITKLQAQEQGINVRSLSNPSTWKSNAAYHDFVALKAVLSDRLEEKQEDVFDANKEVLLTENRIRNDATLSRIGQSLRANSSKNYTGNEYWQNLDEGTLSTQNETDTAEGVSEFKMESDVAKLAALLQYREEMESALEANKDNPNFKTRRGLKNILKDINKQIDYLKSRCLYISDSLGISVGGGYNYYINRDKKISTLKDVEDYFVIDQDNHDDLKEVYLNQIKANSEYESSYSDLEALVGKLQRVDEDGNVRDLNKDDESWNPLYDLKHTKYTGGQALDIIEGIERAKEDDAEFEDAIEMIYQDGLKAEHLNEASEWAPEVKPTLSRPVLDKGGNQVVITYDENGRPSRRLAKGEYMDGLGRVWETEDFDSIPFGAAQKVETLEDSKAEERKIFVESWNTITGDTLPLTEEGLIDRAALSAAGLRESLGATLNSVAGPITKPVLPPPPPPQRPEGDGNPRKPYIKPETYIEKSKLNETYDMILEKYAWSNENVLNDDNGYHTTSTDYFIKVDGKVVRASRVHSVMPEPYLRENEIEKRNSYYNRISKLGYDELLSEIAKIQEETGIDLNPYILYIQDNRQLFFENPEESDIKELDTTLHSIAQESLGKRQSTSISMGTIADELFRNFFGSEELYSLAKTQEGLEQLFDYISEDGRTYRQLFGNNIQQFKLLTDQLIERRDYYKQLGWKLTTVPVVWHTKFEGVGWVAGETDMLGIDKEGLIHIIDFKTSLYSFYPEYQTNVDLGIKYFNDLKKLKSTDVNGDLLSEKANKLLDEIKTNESVDDVIILWKNGVAVISTPIDRFKSLPNQSFGQVISTHDNYSNQQTAYAEMIVAETGGQVASIQILPAVCSYDRGSLNIIYSITLEEDYPLPFSEAMRDILQNQNNDNLVINSIKDQIKDAHDALLMIKSELQATFDQQMMDNLSDDGKFLLSDYISQIDNIDLSAILEKDNVGLLQSFLNELTTLLDLYPSLMKDLREDYKETRSRITALLELEARRQAEIEREKAELDNLPLQPSGSQYAANKNDSMGNISHTNLNYRMVESNRDLELATIHPNFFSDSEIELYVENGEVYCNITFQGNTWNGILIDTKYNGTYFPKGRLLYDKIVELLKQLQPGQKIIATKASLFRTAGRIKLLQDEKTKLYVYQPVNNTDMFATEDILDVEFSDVYGKVGFVNNSGVAVTFALNATAQKTIWTWRNSSQAPVSGSLIFLKVMKRPAPEKNAVIPIAMDRKKLQENDINFIIQLLQNPDLLDKPYIVSGETGALNINATGRQLANLLIPIVDDSSQIGGALSILRNPANPNQITLLKRESMAAGRIDYGPFDINSQKGLSDLIAVLSTLSVSERHDVLLSRLGSDTNNLLPFKGLREFFKTGQSSVIKVGDSLIFNIEDFKTKQSSTGVKRSGLSGLGFYIKSGMLTTLYKEIGFANVEINDVQITEDSSPLVQENGALEVPLMPDEQIEDTSILDGLFRTVDPNDTRELEALDVDQAIKNIRKILGDDVPVLILDEITNLCFAEGKIVGRCRADAIQLTKEAPKGTEFHEAFHRIVDLLMNPYARKNLYEKVAERIGADLNTKEGNRQVAEWLADAYTDYQNDRFEQYPSFINKILNFIRDFVNWMFRINDRNLYRLYLEINTGKYKNIKPTKQAIARFNSLYGHLDNTIEGVSFNHIVNQAMYDKLMNTALFCIITGQPVDKSGRNIAQVGRNINKETLKAGIDLWLKRGYDLIGQNTDDPTVGQLAFREIYDNFDNESLQDHIANELSDLSTDYIKIQEEESRENAEGEDVTASSIGEHTRSPYEFSRFDKTTSRVRFFFATIPDTMWQIEETKNPDGTKSVKKVQKLALNELGLPLFVPVKAAFNEVLNNFHDIDTLPELLERLSVLSKEDSMYSTLYSAINELYKKVYKRPVGEPISRNSDNEALLSQLMNVIRSNKHSFNIVKATSGSNNPTGAYTLKLLSTDTDYNATFYPTQWNLILVNGGTPYIKISENGTLIFNPRVKGSQFAFERIGLIFSQEPQLKTAPNGAKYYDVGIKQWLSNFYSLNPQQQYLTLKVNGKPVFLNNPEDVGQIKIVKDTICQCFNAVGIMINPKELDYMLFHKYGSTDAKALNMMFSSTSIEDSMTSFIQFLKDVTKNGVIKSSLRIRGKSIKLEDVYSKLAFVRNLANWKYQYRHSRDQLTVLATGNNKYYEISDNNFISDVARDLSKRGELFDDLKNDPYVYSKTKDELGGDQYSGSLIIETLDNDESATIKFENFVGMQTDKRNDTGSDYFEISERDDYVSKATILHNNGIIAPTLSDKKTYGYLSGIKLPGLDYSHIVDDYGNIVPMSDLGDQFVISKDPISQLEYTLSQNVDVIERIHKYVMSEYASIKKAEADIEEMEKLGVLQDDVLNFYTKKQGAKFASLLGVWEYTYKTVDGQQVVSGEKFISFNNSKKTIKQNIKTAEEHFFNKSREELYALLQRCLHKLLLSEIDTAVRLGLIEKTGDSNNVFQNYKNVGFDSNHVLAIYKSLVTKNGEPVDAKAEENYKSLAVIIYLNDVMVKSIMSGQEWERVFAGSPLFYKWNYEDFKGNLTDRTVDELKRLGGLGSTGNNNFTELQDIPEKYLDDEGNFSGEYVCAQIADEEIASPLISKIESGVTYGQLLDAAYNKGYLPKDVDSKSISELESLFTEDELSIIKKKSSEVVDSFRKDINVTDGASYITDTMAELLLRMNGNYSSQIELAFKILREEKPSTILEKQAAYAKVVTTVIGTQKYTAFGRRKHQRTGVMVPYYNKTAIFPIFKCIATGKLANIYSKMQQQGVDMLMMDSAVKVGGQGSQTVNWDDYMSSSDETDPNNHIGGDLKNPLKPTFDDPEAFKFLPYKQKFKFLRKQLNTDANEEYIMQMGTQMGKVIFSTWVSTRQYVTNSGEEIDGNALRDRIMSTIKTLSERGANRVCKRFFKTNDKGELINSSDEVVSANSDDLVLDSKKFSKELLRILQSKNPNLNIVDGLQIVEYQDLEGNTKYRTRLPLNAISDAKWLESSLISNINKDVIDVNTTGSAFIQRSVWATEGSALYEKGKGSILSDEDLPKSINGGNRLQMINEEGSMDCVVSIDFIKKMLGGELPKVPIKDENRKVIWDRIPETDARGNAKKDGDGNIIYKTRKNKDGSVATDAKENPIYKRKIRTREMSPSELRNYLIKREIIGPNAKANIIGYRIPTQAQSSIHALRIVDILPAVNDTVILPAEFTKITGSDFDIDKLFLSCVQYKTERSEGEDGKYHQNVTDEFEETEDVYYRNQLIKDYITVLLDKDPTTGRPRNGHLSHRPIDNDTAMLKQIIRDIESNKGAVPEVPFGFYTLTAQTASKNDYITGKIGIGPFALNNNNHILTMMYGVTFKNTKTGIMDKLGLTRLDNKTDLDGQSIMSWISALINAHVDIAKDPYITKLNVNPFTYNLTNLLIRTGLGRKTFYFTTQPIMKELATAYMDAASTYMADQYKSKYTLLREAIESVADKWFKDLKIDTREWSKITFKSEETGQEYKAQNVPEEMSAADIINAVQNTTKHNAVIREAVNRRIKLIFDSELISSAKSTVQTKSDIERQFFIYLAYLQFDKYANALSSLVKYSKIDTKKHGKSTIEQDVYWKGYTRTYDTSRDDNLFEPFGLRRMNNMSFIASKTSLAIGLTRNILRRQFLQSSPAVSGTMAKIIHEISAEDSLSVLLMQKVSGAIDTAIKSKFFVDEYVPSITDNKNFIRELITESQDQSNVEIGEDGFTVKLQDTINHDPKTYIGGYAHIYYYKEDGKRYVISLPVVAATENSIIVSKKVNAKNGVIVLTGGKNTIHDRMLRLQTKIYSDPRFSSLLNSNGEIQNQLLSMLVPGTTTAYTPNYVTNEAPDTYPTAKFVKLFNFVEDDATTANYIILAWDELLNFTSEDKEAETEVREFARDLIVYAFITSGDKQGFTKMFKYVPASWRTQSGFGEYIDKKLLEYQSLPETELDTDDIILNNWFDNDIVRTYSTKDKKTKAPIFLMYYTTIGGYRSGYPTVLAALTKDPQTGLYTASIDPYRAPKFIKLRRRSDRLAYDSQRLFTIFKYHGIAVSKSGVKYPIYVKVNPKGNSISGGFLITEYGRSDAIGQQEYTINEEALRKVYQAADFANHVLAVKATEPIYASIVEGLARQYDSDRELNNQLNQVKNNGESSDVTSTVSATSNAPVNEKPDVSVDIRPQNRIEKMFGRSVVGLSERKYITESRSIKINNVEFNATQQRSIELGIERILELFGDIINSGNSNLKKVTVPYRQFKNINESIVRDVRDWMYDNNLYNDVDGDIYGVYDKDTKTITVSEAMYRIAQILDENSALEDFIYELGLDTESFLNGYISETEEVSPTITSAISEILEDEEDEDVRQMMDVRYSYSDSRQLDLFDESDKQDAEDIMNKCKGV